MLVKLPQAYPAYIFPFVSLVSQGVFDCGSPEYQLTPASPFRESHEVIWTSNSTVLDCSCDCSYSALQVNAKQLESDSAIHQQETSVLLCQTYLGCSVTPCNLGLRP